jgi:threonine dehydratase
MPLTTYADVSAAAARLRGRVLRTPLLESLSLNLLTRARVLVKAECLQTGGSFKIRGALHRVLLLPDEERQRGVVAFSSGNFGQGLAAACGQIMDPPVRCTIVMPEDTPRAKQERARAYGAAVVLSSVVDGVNREVTAAELAESLSREHGFTLLHPFEDPDVIAGQGSCAVEFCEQCADEYGLARGPDVLLIPIGGGGLAAGCALATKARFPNTLVYAVEPEGYDDHFLSLNRGSRVSLRGNPPTLCDSLQAVSPGKNTFPITRKLLAGVLVVTDAEVRHAMRAAFDHLQLGLEPGGAVGLAAVLAGKVPGGDVAGKTIGIIASGGNLDVDKFAKVLGCRAKKEGGGEGKKICKKKGMARHTTNTNTSCINSRL